MSLSDSNICHIQMFDLNNIDLTESLKLSLIPMSKLDDNLTKLDDNLTKLDDNLTKLDDNLTKLDDNLTKLDDNCTKLDDKLTKIDDDWSKLGDDLTTLEISIASGVSSSDCTSLTLDLENIRMFVESTSRTRPSNSYHPSTPIIDF